MRACSLVNVGAGFRFGVLVFSAGAAPVRSLFMLSSEDVLYRLLLDDAVLLSSSTSTSEVAAGGAAASGAAQAPSPQQPATLDPVGRGRGSQQEKDKEKEKDETERERSRGRRLPKGA